MKKLLLIIAFVCVWGVSESVAQSEGELVGVGNLGFTLGNDVDFILNLEADYFIMDNLAATGGIQFWDRMANLAIGAKYYVNNNFYGRARGLFIGDVDFDLGVGYQLPLDRNLELDLGADYYFGAGKLGLQAGIAYRF
ncbi:hypothetical protein FUAX_29880 [Fulvitalea axinellae]|uniref:Outer membrane protein beta-barrel domain-containing protein n=1 Tax=Fulvitalea axinellae TaxID=1182444 RepID=A0AAU9DBS0_9BACT|nr:hypothetical protein FUAX_29880 [Fulvitalea axinellae]